MEVGSPGSHSASGRGGREGRGMEFRCSIRPAYTAELPPFSAESGTLAHRLAGRNFTGKGRVGSDQPGVSCGACGRAESTQLRTVGLQPAHAPRCPRAYPRWKGEAEVHMENPGACSSFSFMADLYRTSPGSLSMRKQRVGRRLAANFGFALAADLRIVPVHRLLLSGWWLQHASFL